MGASSSMNITTDIYISYAENNKYIQTIEHNLRNLNYEVIDSSIIMKSFVELSNMDISNYVETIVQKTKYIFVCISPKTIKSITQILELNEIINKKPELEKKLIYFIMDIDYTPNTNPELISIIQKNKWFPLYDENTVFDATSKVLTLMMNDL
jgi:hypothetical protein